MTLKAKLRSHLVTILFGRKFRTCRRRWAELRRKLSGNRHTVHVFLALDDPYSYLLSAYLPSLGDTYDIDLKIHLTEAVTGGFRPEADMLARYAVQDCQLLASELGIPFLDRGDAPPVEQQRALIDALADRERIDSYDDDVLQALTYYWRADIDGVAKIAGKPGADGQGDALLRRNEALLARLGHYNAATMYYAGEWYWGADRLHYLTDRLDEMGLRRDDAPGLKVASVRQISQLSLPVSPPSSAKELPPLELFFSFRSPYSYLALQRVYEIADAFGLDLIVRPVLPMVMRGMQVPKSKMLYIAADTSREADRLSIAFGQFADPIGPGVERCLATYFYAVGEKKVCCPKEAAKLAEASKGHIHFCVADREFDSQTDAQMALCIKMIRKPAVDEKRYNSVWEDKVLALKGLYEMSE